MYFNTPCHARQKSSNRTCRHFLVFRRLRRMQCYLTINSQIRDCRACRDGESRKRRKSNARVESGVEQDQRASGLLLVLTKPPFIANLIFGSKVVKCFFLCQNGSGDISNESGEQGLSISRLHSHEALSRHGVHTSRVIFCEEFAFVADERLCVEFEGFTHCLRDPPHNYTIKHASPYTCDC